MTTDEIRRKYLSFFEGKAHRAVASDSLVPQNDPTLLFTGAGMNQFKENFLGLKKDLTRAASSQKCLRTADLEEVGRTAFHHSFFEMLGNFSFGDYFKREAILWAWEFLTIEMKIPRERLRVSVHKTDDEAFFIWKNEVGIREDWIYRLGDKDNFWPSNAPQDGPNGPCGPCSEIYFDQDPSQGDGGTVQDRRFAEIWNLVFTQFDRQDGGVLKPLAQKNIDTGMGLERLACVLQGQKTNYEIDSFKPINAAIERALGLTEGAVQGPLRSHLYAVSDHIRAIVFTMADGVIPSNEGRGYVIRKLIRRALWRAHQILSAGKGESGELRDAFLYRIVPVVAEVMGRAYPELQEAKASIAMTLKSEEERFLDTLETGLKILAAKIASLEKSGASKLPGSVVFELYDTYGFPDELTRMIGESRGLAIDVAEFQALMEEQRQRAKQASQISGSIFAATELEKQLTQFPATRFLGYSALEAEAKVLFADIHGSKGVVLLDQTPFYGESGGQAGDQGVLESSDFKARVTDTQKKDGFILHAVELISGQPCAGSSVSACVDRGRRERVMRNHTGTHLLHAALRQVLGPQARQLGSLVNAEKLRFDFSHPQALTAAELRTLEDLVNAQILADTQVIKEEKPLEEAKKDGALAFFGEKYGDLVRVVNIPGFSKEFCGGTHCASTGQIGLLIITSDSSIASGTRRIEALTGEGAMEYLRNLRAQVAELAMQLKTTPDKLGEKISRLADSVKKLEKEKKQGAVVNADPRAILMSAVDAGSFKVAGHKLASGAGAEDMRALSDTLRSMSSKTVYFLGAENEEKVHFVIGLSPDLAQSSLDAREAMKKLAELVGGSGGGRKELVQGGARNAGQFRDRWASIVDGLAAYVKERNS